MFVYVNIVLCCYVTFGSIPRLGVLILNESKRVRMTLNRSHEIGTLRELDTPPDGHVF